jgi:hypothetical protein
MRQSIQSSIVRLLVLLASLSLAGCGGGGGNGGDSATLLGFWTGTVDLIENGCPREIPQEFRSISFTHNITQEVVSTDLVNVFLQDGDLRCAALNVRRDSDYFAAVCPERLLPGFLPDLECKEELVWEYTYDPDDGVERIKPLGRTAFVRCSSNGAPQLACPVEYSGEGFRCFRGICP